MKLIRIFVFFMAGIGVCMAHATDVSLRDKIGQMLIIGFDGTSVNSESGIIKDITEDNIGGVILFDYDAKTFADKNIINPQQVKQLISEIKKYSLKAQLPLLVSIDYEGGTVKRLTPEHGFPETLSAKAIAKTSLDEASRQADLMANLLKDLGFNVNFAPSADVDVNPSNPIIGARERSFSNDPKTVAMFARTYSKQFLNNGLQCAYKHFPGHGSSTDDSHWGFVDVTDTWSKQELEPFQSLLAEPSPCGMVMTAHLVNRRLDDSGLPATLSHKVLTDLLRHEMYFKGVVITDDMQMKAIASHYGLKQSVTLAINAGADMLIFGNQISDTPQRAKPLIDMIAAQVEAGEISKSRIDEAYERIVALKNSIRDVPGVNVF